MHAVKDVPPALRRAADSSQAILMCARRIRAAYLTGEPIEGLNAEFRQISAENDRVMAEFQAAVRAGDAKPSEDGRRLALRMMQATEQVQALLGEMALPYEGVD